MNKIWNALFVTSVLWQLDRMCQFHSVFFFFCYFVYALFELCLIIEIKSFSVAFYFNQPTLIVFENIFTGLNCVQYKQKEMKSEWNGVEEKSKTNIKQNQNSLKQKNLVTKKKTTIDVASYTVLRYNTN